MESGLGKRLGVFVDVADRIVKRLLRSEIPLERSELEEALPAILREDAPLAPPELVGEVIDRLVGLGPIERLLRDELISDVLVNGPDDVWVEREGLLSRADVRFRNAAEVSAAVERVIAPLGLRLDLASPTVDARLPDGSRLHATIPPVAPDGPVLAIRRFTRAVADLPALVAAHGVSSAGAAFLSDAVADRRTIIVSGGTGTGKTTLLNILSVGISPDERIVTVEDAPELRLAGHVVRLAARPHNADGSGAISLRDLVRVALRLRPDRIVVGEVRGPEALDLVNALNTGHRGSMSTVHANSPEEALWRIETLALLGREGLEPSIVRRQLWAGIDLVVQMTRDGARRRIAGIAELSAGELVEVYRP